jgi:hypothetical protein
MSRASRASCRSQWMLEAARAGQLAPAEAAQLREHLQSGCAACKSEKRYHAWLTESLLESEPVCDEVALRRLRRATLQQAHGQSFRAPRRWRREGMLLGTALTLAVAIAVWHGFGRTPEVVVTPLTAAASVSRRSELDREVVVLGDGVYELSVRRRLFDRQVVVQVPEGEIQDVGTVFGVSVLQGKTARVAVSQGAVLLHLRGVPEVRLEAGGAWEPARLEVETVPITLVPEVTQPESGHEAAAEFETRVPSTSKRGLEISEKLHHRARPHAVRRADETESSRGNDSNNAELEGAGEDATYLRVLDLLRQRRTADAQRLAELYLQHFPRGFRRPEVERIANSDSQ